MHLQCTEKMRLDKFLKVSRIIKRRTVANEAADGGRIEGTDRMSQGLPGEEQMIWERSL